KRGINVRHLIGCTAGGVIGGGHEVEERPAVSLTVAQLPDVDVTPFVVHQEGLPDPDGGPKPWRDLIGAKAETNPGFVILSDPFSLDADAFVSGLDFAYPGSITLG